MKLLLFGIAREMVGAAELDVPAARTVADLKTWLQTQYPALGGLRSLAVAVDREYADDSRVIGADSEIAIIPPVSGG